MLTIFTTNKHNQEVESIIQSAKEGLGEIVNCQPIEELDTKKLRLLVKDGKIEWSLEWFDQAPPLVVDSFLLNPNNLLTFVFAKLGHLDLAFQYCREESIQKFLEYLNGLLNGMQPTVLKVDPNSFFENYNNALFIHYTGQYQTVEELKDAYEKALNLTSNSETKALVSKQYGVLLSDLGELEKAENLLRNALVDSLSEEGKNAIQFELVKLLMQQISIPYDQNLIQEIKGYVQNLQEYFSTLTTNLPLAMLLREASEIANIENNYSEALSYINQAINLFESEEVPELLATAVLRKGTLLYTWAQDGNPQFYKTAIGTYQEALKTFKKDNAPQIFAEIHHHLGVIYAEIAREGKEGAVHAAFSATSFKESLAFYNEQDYAYEFAMIANNYANALLKYPPAKQGDNVEKAIHFYMKALEIRTPEQYPVERALTILNYLEACWRAHNVNSLMERVRYKDMLEKAKEIASLVEEESLLYEAKTHLEKLKELGQVLVKEANAATI